MFAIRRSVLPLVQSSHKSGGIAVVLLRPFSSSLSRTRTRPRTRTGIRSRRKATGAAVPYDDYSHSNIVKDVETELPTPEMAKTMAQSYRSMDNTALTTLGAMGNHSALKEMLKRHIMNKDCVEYQRACDTFLIIEQKNHELEIPMALPFQIGISACVLAGVLSIPMVFHLPVVEYFNEHFVTADHPPTKELETALEVGAWSWNWMEPVMGTSTFLLLTLQYMRMHLHHLGVTPYTHHMKRFRGKRLAEAFPQYNEKLLFAYSESSPMYNPKDLWI